MSTHTSKTNTPRLRFPEFREAGAWVYKNGDEVFKQVSNKNHNSDLPTLAITQKKGAVPRDEIDYTVIATEKSVESYKVVEIGDFIISLRSFQGGIEYSNYKGICSPAYVILRKKIDVEDHFFKCYFKTDLFIQDLNKNLEGIRDGKMVSYKQFSELLLPIPPKPEQQKIAATLTTLDDLITAQGERIKALQSHKKGLMQQLFPAEGETVPRVRFAEFEGEWEEKALGELIEIKGRIGYRGYTVEDIVKEGEGAIALSPSNLSGEGSLSFEKSTFISWYKYEESPEIMLEEGHTLLVKTGSTYGKSALVNKLPVKATINPQLVVLKPVQVNSVFLFLIVSSNAVQKQIEKTVVGGAIPTLSQDSISKFVVLVPSNAEQQKIAAVLTSLDDLLAAQGERLEALKMQKRGLMQGMFPGGGDGANLKQSA